jgi:hypothetical protein
LKAIIEIDGTKYLLTKTKALAVMEALGGAPTVRIDWDRTKSSKTHSYVYSVSKRVCQVSMEFVEEHNLHLRPDECDPDHSGEALAKPSRTKRTKALGGRDPVLLLTLENP